MEKKILMNSGPAAFLVGAAFTRSITVDQINANRGGAPLRRQAAVRNIDEEARTVEVAFSSEEPVPRWFGDEILDHSAGAMLDTRLQNGAAVLWNHDADIQIGVVEAASIDSDRRGRATLRFGRSARAEEIWADIADGVIRHVSVGYFVRAITTEEREGETDKVTITEWEPYEISLVSVPADATVGVGRGAGEPPEEAGSQHANTDLQTQTDLNEGTRNMERILRHNGALVRARVDDNGNVLEVLEVLETADATRAIVQQGVEAAEQRIASIRTIADQHSVQALVDEAIINGTTVDQFRQQVLDHIENRSTADLGGNQPLSDAPMGIGLTDRQADDFNFMRALNYLANPNDQAAREAAAFEREASAAAAQYAVRGGTDGIIVPYEVLTRALNTGTDGAAPGNTGGLAIDNTLLAGDFISLLRNESSFLKLARRMGGLRGNYSMIGQASGGRGYWVDDDEDVGLSTQDLRDIDMSPKPVGTYSELTRHALQQTTPDVENMVRSDIAQAIALAIDYAGFYGDGVKKPLGLKNTGGINAVAFAGPQPTYEELVGMETEIAANNAAASAMAYCANARFKGHCMVTQRFAGTNGATIMEPGSQINGYKALISNQVEDGDVFFGNFRDAVVGSWGGLELNIDRTTHGLKGRVRIIAIMDADVVFRRVESFTYGSMP